MPLISSYKCIMPRDSEVRKGWRLSVIDAIVFLSGKVFDYSGVRLRIASQEPQNLAGIYLFIPGGGGIPANTEGKVVLARRFCFLRFSFQLSS